MDGFTAIPETHKPVRHQLVMHPKTAKFFIELLRRRLGPMIWMSLDNHHSTIKRFGDDYAHQRMR